MLAIVPTLRRPALRRSEDANALFATDLPLLADAADFCRLAEKHGWRTWMQGGWLLLDENLGWRGYMGCALIFGGIILSQVKIWKGDRGQ